MKIPENPGRQISDGFFKEKKRKKRKQRKVCKKSKKIPESGIFSNVLGCSRIFWSGPSPKHRTETGHAVKQNLGHDIIRCQHHAIATRSLLTWQPLVEKEEVRLFALPVQEVCHLPGVGGLPQRILKLLLQRCERVRILFPALLLLYRYHSPVRRMRDMACG